MKIKATSEQIEAIKNAIALIGIKPFRSYYSGAKENAQWNADGRTHYYDDDTLRAFKGRVVDTWVGADGLLFCALCSDSADWHNTRRICRVVVHDVFGYVVYRPSLADAAKNFRTARKAFEAFEFDLVAYYVDALQRGYKERAGEAALAAKAVELLDCIG
jgi:hypothetical protein